jgi:hypothetical protein
MVGQYPNAPGDMSEMYRGSICVHQGTMLSRRAFETPFGMLSPGACSGMGCCPSVHAVYAASILSLGARHAWGYCPMVHTRWQAVPRSILYTLQW